MPQFQQTVIGMKFTATKLIAVALLWVGLAALVYVPTSDGGPLSAIVAGIGFLSFASGFLMIADALKGEIIEQMQRQQSM